LELNGYILCLISQKGLVFKGALGMKYTNDNIEYDDNFRILAKTEKYTLGHFWNDALIYNNITKETIHTEEFVGDPECGLIIQNEETFIIGGYVLICFKKGKRVEISSIRDVEDMRIVNKNIVEILIDPWSDNSVIWELNIQSMNFVKKKDFNKYKKRKYSNHIDW